MGFNLGFKGLTEYVVESVELYTTNKLVLRPLVRPLVSTDVTFPREFLHLLNLPIFV